MLVTLPVMAATLRRQDRRDRWALTALWLAPSGFGLVFASWYYGTPLPNAITARLAASDVVSVELQHGVAWLADAIARDPLAMGIIASGIVLGTASPALGPSGPRTLEPPDGSDRQRQLGIGCLLFIICIVITGGDPMSGRWLGVPLIVAAIQIARDRRLERPMAGGLAIAAVLAAAAITPQQMLRSDSMFGQTLRSPRAPIDARAADYQATGLLTNVRQSRPPAWPGGAQAFLAWRDPSRVLVARDHPGFAGFAAGYGVYVVDVSGRGDPLLARLAPSASVDATDVAPVQAAGWLEPRDVPEGYVPSLPSHEIRLGDPAIADAYGQIRLLTRGSLWDWRRLVAAWQVIMRMPHGVGTAGSRTGSGS